MKKTIIWAMLAMLLPITQAWANWPPASHSNHTGSISVTKVGEGTVYLSTANNATEGKTSDTWSCNSSSSNDSKTYYLYAKPATGWDFAGWSGSGTSGDNPYKVTPNAQNGSHTYTATFSRQCLLSFQATENGTYSATDGTSSIALTSAAATLSTAKEVTMTAKPATGYTIDTWWYQESGKSRVDLGNNLTYKRTFAADATVGVDFKVKGDTVLNKTTGAKYGSLNLAIAAVAEGEDLELIDNDELAEDVTLPTGVRFFVPEGKTYVVPSGKTLTISGTLFNMGTLTVDGTADGAGSIVKTLKVITQTGMGASGQEPYVPYEKMKYFKTALSTIKGTVNGSGTVSCTQSPYVKIVRYNGVSSYHALGASTTVVCCTVNTAVANNCIKDYDSIYDNLGSAFDNRHQSVDPNYEAIFSFGYISVLLDNGSVSKGSANVADSFAVDAAGKTVSISGNQANNSAVLLTFNASSASMPKLTNAGAWFVNCDSCSVSSVNANSDVYTSNIRYFDCGKGSISAPSAPNGGGKGGVFFFAGEYSTYTYNVSFKSNYRVYGGLFSNDPTSYLAANDLEVVSESGKYRVRKQAQKIEIVKVGDTGYETLQAAVDAANGGTVTLMQDIELPGDLTIAANQSCIIELAGFDITGHSIINRGTLTIEDSSNYDEYGKVTSAITNYGTLKTVYGEYSGAFTAAGGTFTLQGGIYRSSLTGEGFVIKSGKFASNVTSRLNLDDMQIIWTSVPSLTEAFYWVGPKAQAGMEKTSISGTDIAIQFPVLVPSSDLTLHQKYLKKGFDRAQYSDTEWYRLSEIFYTLQPLVSPVAECTLCFDRDVPANTISGYGKIDVYTQSGSITTNHPAGSLYWTTIPSIMAKGNTPISYGRFLNGEVSASTIGVKNNSNRNIGTTCTLAFQYGFSKENCWYRHPTTNARVYYDWDFHPLASYDYKFTGGSKKAMVDYVLKDTLQTAINEVSDNGVVMLANDDAEAIVVTKATTFTIDANNFVFTGSVAAGEGYEMSATGPVDGKTTYTFTHNPVKLTLADISHDHATVVSVMTNGVELEESDWEAFTVPYETELVVAYEPKAGYEEIVPMTNVVTGTTVDMPTVTPTEYSIFYINLAQGDVNGNPSSYTIESSDIKLVELERTEYEFLGWFTDWGLTKRVGDDDVAIRSGSMGSRVFYASWRHVPIALTIPAVEHTTLRVSVPGGEVKPTTGSTYNLPFDVDVTISYVAEAGYAFGGESEVVIVLKKVNKESVLEDVPTATAIDYTISYELYGGTKGSNCPAGYTVVSDGITVSDPTKEGYEFGGWYEDALFTKKCGEVTIPTGSTGDKTLYASWLSKVATVVEAKDDEGQDAEVSVVVPENWITNAVGASATEAEIKEKLQETADNGLKNWQNFALDTAGVTDVGTTVTVEKKEEPASASDVTVTIKTAETVKKVAVVQVESITNATVTVLVEEKDISEVAAEDGKKEAEIEVNYAELKEGIYRPAVVVEDVNQVKTMIPDVSVPAVQVVKDDKKAETTVLAVPFNKGLDGEKLTIASVIDTSSLADGDTIKKYNNASGNYDVWEYNADNKTWKGIQTVGAVETTPVAAGDLELEAGQALIVERSGEATNNVLTMVGQYAETVVTPIEQPVATAEEPTPDPVWNLVGNAGAGQEFDLNQIDAVNADDMVVVPDDKGQQKRLRKNADNKWCYTTNVIKTVTVRGKERKVATPVEVTDESKVSKGGWFWYVSGGGAGKTEINWKKK